MLSMAGRLSERGEIDPPSHFFNDCLGFDDADAEPYTDSGPNVDNDGAILAPFNPFGGKLGMTPADGRDLEPREDGGWDEFAEQMGDMDPSDQKPLFVDPGLYSPESEEEEVKPQIEAIAAPAVAPSSSTRPSTRRGSSSKSLSQGGSKSGSSSTDVTPPEQDPPKRRKARKLKKESNTAEEEQKRNKFLERNRIAASKCREKKKQYVSELEDTKFELEARHAQLQRDYNDLISEVTDLKHHLMAHAKCNDPNIDRWISNEARRFVEAPPDAFGQPFTPFPANPRALPTPSPQSRNPSISSSYPSMQFEPLGSAERQGSIAYSQGKAADPSVLLFMAGLAHHPPGTVSLYPSPTGEAFPSLTPGLKREPGINYDHMPDSMFSPGQSTFGGG